MERKIVEQLKGGLIVSCQALKDEPLHNSHIMAQMAYAAWQGGVDIIATDCTVRERPYGKKLIDFFTEIRSRYPKQLFMADCSDYKEGLLAA